MTTGNETAQSAQNKDEVDRDHQELARNPLEKTDRTDAPDQGAGSEPPD